MPDATQHSYLELPVQTRAADVRPGSWNADKRTVEVVASTGAMVRRSGFMTEYDEEIPVSEQVYDLRRIVSVGPVLDQHESGGRVAETVLGRVTRAWIERGLLIKELEFDTDQNADAVFQKIGRGMLRSVSLGYDADYERVRAKDRQDGGTRDLYRATRVEPYEISIVAMPADAGAVVRGLPTGATRRYVVRDATPPAPAEPPEVTPAVPVQERAMPTPENAGGAAALTAGPSAEQTKQIQREAVAAYAKRVTDARAVLARHALDEGQAESLVERFGDDTKLRSHVLELLAERDVETPSLKPQVRVEAGSTSYEKLFEVAKRGMLCRMSGAKPESNEVGAFARMSVTDVGAELLEARGVSHKIFRGMGRLERAKVLMGASPIPGMSRAAPGGMGSSDLSILLGAVFGSRLQQKYMELPDEWKRVGLEVNLDDFTEVPVYGFSNFPPLEDVAEGAEIQRGAFKQSSYNVQLGKGGRIISFTWEMMVNDRFSVLEMIINDRFQAVKRYERRKFVAALLANKIGTSATDFFSVGNANIAAATGAPSATTLISGFKTMALQKGIAGVAGEDDALGDRLGLIPQRWLLGAEDIITAQQLLEPGAPNEPAQVSPSASTSRATRSMRALADNLVMEPDLDGQSPIFNVLFSNPQECAAVQYGHLTEQPGPFVQEQDGFEVTGKDYAVIDPFYVVLGDPRGAVKITRT